MDSQYVEATGEASESSELRGENSFLLNVTIDESVTTNQIDMVHIMLREQVDAFF